MARIGCFPRITTAVGLLAAGATLAPVPAGAQTAQQLSVGQAATLQDPGIYLPAPTDGRLNSYGAAVHVEGLVFSQQADTGSGQVIAAPGDELVVLHLSTAWFPSDLADEMQLQLQEVALSVDSGGTSAPLQLQLENDYPSPDDGYYAAAVPKGAPADLTLSVAGLLPQHLDLRTGSVDTPGPTALYRAGYAPLVDVRPTAVQSFSATSDQGQATGQFGVSAAYLSYWRPFSTDTADTPGDAYLDVEFAHSQLSLPGYDSVSPAAPLPTGAVQFQLPDGRLVAATERAPVDLLFDTFSGDFYAQVPADITSFKVIVAPGPLSVQVPGPDGYHQQTIQLDLGAPLTTTVLLPPAWSAPQPAAPAGPGTVPAGDRAAAKGGSDLAVILVAVLGGLLLVLVGTVLLARRRRIDFDARPVAWPPPGLGPAAVLLMEPPVPRALPPVVDGAGPPTAGFGPPVEPRHNQGDGAPPPTPVLVARLLGPVEIDGLIKPIRSEPLLRLLIVLLISTDRAMSADELAMLVSKRSTRDPKTPSLQSYASRLRPSLPPGLLPDASQSGYRLDHSAITVDWVVLATVAAEPTDQPGWPERAAAALELVRGVPLDGCRWEGIEPFARAMQAQIDRLARDLAALRLAANDPAGAELAVSQGLTGVPLSVGLWEQRLHAAAAGSGYGLERAWSDAQAVLGPDCGLLAGTYQRLSRALGDRPPANA